MKKFSLILVCLLCLWTTAVARVVSLSISDIYKDLTEKQDVSEIPTGVEGLTITCTANEGALTPFISVDDDDRFVEIRKNNNLTFEGTDIQISQIEFTTSDIYKFVENKVTPSTGNFEIDDTYAIWTSDESVNKVSFAITKYTEIASIVISYKCAGDADEVDDEVTLSFPEMYPDQTGSTKITEIPTGVEGLTITCNRDNENASSPAIKNFEEDGGIVFYFRSLNTLTFEGTDLLITKIVFSTLTGNNFTDKATVTSGYFKIGNNFAVLTNTAGTNKVSVHSGGSGKSVNIVSMTISYKRIGGTDEDTDSTTTGVESVVAVDDNAPVEYFNMQGVRVANPQNGLYVRRQGNKATKVLIQ